MSIVIKASAGDVALTEIHGGDVRVWIGGQAGEKRQLRVYVENDLILIAVHASDRHNSKQLELLVIDTAQSITSGKIVIDRKEES